MRRWIAILLLYLALLPAADREAIAAYLKAIPGHPNGYTRN